VRTLEQQDDRLPDWLAVALLVLGRGQEPELDALPPVFAGHRADRDRLLAGGGDWLDVWNPYAFRDEEDVIHPVAGPDGDAYRELAPADAERWRTVRDALEPHVLSPADWVLARGARRLNQEPLALAATDDLVVWVFVPDFDEAELLQQLVYVLAPEKLQLLMARGLVGDAGA